MCWRTAFGIWRKEFVQQCSNKDHKSNMRFRLQLRKKVVFFGVFFFCFLFFKKAPFVPSWRALYIANVKPRNLCWVFLLAKTVG